MSGSAPEDTQNLDRNVARRIEKKLREWGRENYRSFPWRKPDRIWHGLVAEILLQRTRAGSVVPVYEAFVEAFPDPEDLASASQDRIEEVVRPLGLRWRVPLLGKLGSELVTEHQGRVPTEPDELLNLSGVGDYSAAAFLSLHLNQRAVIIDSNVVRWICRLLNRQKDGETRRKKWLRETADILTPRSEIRSYNYALLDFTMTVCTVSPKCEQCPLGAELCLYGRTVMKNQL